MRSKTEEFDHFSFDNNGDDKRPYSVQGEYTKEYLGERTWGTVSKNTFLEKYGLDKTLLQVLERMMPGRKIFFGYTPATLVEDD